MKKVLLCLLALALLLAGCGYHGAGKGPSVLPEDIHTLAVVKVDNPTLDPSLSQDLRSFFRDEVRRRGRFSFAEPDAADALVQLSIPREILSSRVEDADGETLRFEVRVELSASFTRRVDASPLYSTGVVSAYETFFGGDSEEDEARDSALDLAVRKLVDRLDDGF